MNIIQSLQSKEHPSKYEVLYQLPQSGTDIVFFGFVHLCQGEAQLSNKFQISQMFRNPCQGADVQVPAVSCGIGPWQRYLQMQVTNKIMMVHYNEVRFTPVLSYSNATASKTSLFTANSLTLINKYDRFLNKKASWQSHKVCWYPKPFNSNIKMPSYMYIKRFSPSNGQALQWHRYPAYQIWLDLAIQ